MDIDRNEMREMHPTRKPDDASKSNAANILGTGL